MDTDEEKWNPKMIQWQQLYLKPLILSQKSSVYRFPPHCQWHHYILDESFD